MKLIDKDALVAEITKIYDRNRSNGFIDVCDELDNILSFLDTSEVKEVDLEKEIQRYLREVHDRDTTVSDVARHFAAWQKQQMMAKAVDATVHIDAGGYPYIPQMELYDYDKDIPLAKEGEKVKVIVIKEN